MRTKNFMTWKSTKFYDSPYYKELQQWVVSSISLSIFISFTRSFSTSFSLSVPSLPLPLSLPVSLFVPLPNFLTLKSLVVSSSDSFVYPFFTPKQFLCHVYFFRQLFVFFFTPTKMYILKKSKHTLFKNKREETKNKPKHKKNERLEKRVGKKTKGFPENSSNSFCSKRRRVNLTISSFVRKSTAATKILCTIFVHIPL